MLPVPLFFGVLLVLPTTRFLMLKDLYHQICLSFTNWSRPGPMRASSIAWQSPNGCMKKNYHRMCWFHSKHAGATRVLFIFCWSLRWRGRDHDGVNSTMLTLKNWWCWLSCLALISALMVSQQPGATICKKHMAQ